MEPIIDQYVSAIQITPKLGIDFDITKFHANWWPQGSNSCHANSRQYIYSSFFKKIPKLDPRDPPIEGTEDNQGILYIPNHFYSSEDNQASSRLEGRALYKMASYDSDNIYFLVKAIDGQNYPNQPNGASLFHVERLISVPTNPFEDNTDIKYFRKCDGPKCVMKHFELTPPSKNRSKNLACNAWPACDNNKWSINNNPFNEIIALYYIHEVIRLILLYNDPKWRDDASALIPEGIDLTSFDTKDILLYKSMIADIYDLFRYKISDGRYRVCVIMPYYEMTLRDLIHENHITFRMAHNNNASNNDIYHYSQNEYNEVLKFSNCLVISKLILQVARFLHRIGCVHHDISIENIMFRKRLAPNEEAHIEYIEWNNQNMFNNRGYLGAEHRHNDHSHNYFECINRPVFIDFCSMLFLPPPRCNKRRNNDLRKPHFSTIVNHSNTKGYEKWFGKPNQLAVENWFLVLPNTILKRIFEIINTNGVLDDNITAKLVEIRRYLCARNDEGGLNWEWDVAKMELGNISNILGKLLLGYYPFHHGRPRTSRPLVPNNSPRLKSLIEFCHQHQHIRALLENNNFFHNACYVDYLFREEEYLKDIIPNTLLSDETSTSICGAINFKDSITTLLHHMIQPKINERIDLRDAICHLNKLANNYDDKLCQCNTSVNNFDDGYMTDDILAVTYMDI